MRFRSRFIYLPMNEYSVVPAPFIEKAVLPPLDCLYTFVKSQLSITVWVYFWVFHFVAFICISVFMPVPHCLLTVAIYFSILGINLTNYIQDLYAKKKRKPLGKEIKNWNKWWDKWRSIWIKRLNIVKIPSLPKLICRLKALLSKSLPGFMEAEQRILKFIWKGFIWK